LGIFGEEDNTVDFRRKRR